MVIKIAVAYWNACLKKLRKKILRSERVCELHVCQPKHSNNPGYYFVVRIRNIMFVIVMLALIFIYRGSKYHDAEFDDLVPADSLTYLKFKEINYPALNVSDIKQLIHQYNTNETILNKCSYECIKWHEIYFVVQVKKYTPSLKYFLVSLSMVRGIEDILLVFSHSYYDENLMKLIQSIDFCRVQQIFYPYSLQVYPNKFPGFEENDCPYDMEVKVAVKKNCNGASSPDAQGFFRHPENAERKHHWWWTANKIFEDFNFNKTNAPWVVFLEDDLYLMEDFLHLVMYMKGVIGSLRNCHFISLSSPMPEHLNSIQPENQASLLEIQPFNPDHHSSALGFDMVTWNKIVGHYDTFCSIDEHSWSKSLFQLSKNMLVNRKKDRFKVISSVLPRAYKISYNGVFERITRRAVFENAYHVVKTQEGIKNSLFPQFFRIFVANETLCDDLKDEILSGGWSDPRDRKLCSNMTLRKIKKYFFNMANQYLQL